MQSTVINQSHLSTNPKWRRSGYPKTRVICSIQDSQNSHMPSRRITMVSLPLGILSILATAPVQPASAFTPPPSGYRFHQDKLDGYSFFYPESWNQVTTSGNDVFYRNPTNIEENLFVDVSSPSSSKFSSVRDLGTPEEAAKRIQSQYLEEFMSTRIGVKRTTDIVSATSRTGADGQMYYDLTFRAKSYASRNQLAVNYNDVQEAVEMEWDRVYYSVLGVAGGRLYQLRLQCAASRQDAGKLDTIAQSFQCKEVL